MKSDKYYDEAVRQASANDVVWVAQSVEYVGDSVPSESLLKRDPKELNALVLGAIARVAKGDSINY